MKKLFALAIIQLFLLSAMQAQDSKNKVPPPPPPAPPHVEKVQFTTPPPPPPVNPAMKKKPAKRTMKFVPPVITKDSLIK